MIDWYCNVVLASETHTEMTATVEATVTEIAAEAEAKLYSITRLHNRVLRAATSWLGIEQPGWTTAVFCLLRATLSSPHNYQAAQLI